MPGIRSVFQRADALGAPADRIPLNRQGWSQRWRRSSQLVTRASLLTLIGQAAQAQAMPAFSGVEISANPSSVRASQDRVDLVIAIAKNATLEEIQLFLPSAKQILRNGQPFALVQTYRDQDQARSTGLALQDSLPWPLELLIYEASHSRSSQAPGETTSSVTPEPALGRQPAEQATAPAPAATEAPPAAVPAVANTSAPPAAPEAPLVSAASTTPATTAVTPEPPRTELDPASTRASSSKQQNLPAFLVLPFNFGSGSSTTTPPASTTEKPSQERTGVQRPAAHDHRNNGNASDLGGELSASALGIAQPSPIQPAEPAPAGSPVQAAAQTIPSEAPTATASAASTPAELAVTPARAAAPSNPAPSDAAAGRAVIASPILSEKPLVTAATPTVPIPATATATATASSTAPATAQPVPEAASAAGGASDSDTQLATGSTATISGFLAIRPDLDYLGVVIGSEQDLVALRRFATVTQMGVVDGKTIARIGVYARSRVGQNLLRQRLMQIRQAGLTPEVFTNRTGASGSAT